MKKTLVVLIITMSFVLLVGCATTAESSPYVEVVEVSGKTSGELFVEVNKWAVETFRKANSVIEFSDKESGVVSGKYSTSIVLGLLPVDVTSMLTVEAREGRYRITIADPTYTDPAFGGIKRLTNATSLAKLQTEWASLSASLKAYISGGGEDW